MADNLFEGLPPPSANPIPSPSSEYESQEPATASIKESSPVPAPKSILKSSLKRPKSSESDPEGDYLSP